MEENHHRDGGAPSRWRTDGAIEGDTAMENRRRDGEPTSRWMGEEGGEGEKGRRGGRGEGEKGRGEEGKEEKNESKCWGKMMEGGKKAAFCEGATERNDTASDASDVSKLVRHRPTVIAAMTSLLRDVLRERILLHTYTFSGTQW